MIILMKMVVEIYHVEHFTSLSSCGRLKLRNERLIPRNPCFKSFEVGLRSCTSASVIFAVLAFLASLGAIDAWLESVTSYLVLWSVFGQVYGFGGLHTFLTWQRLHLYHYS